MGKKKVGRQSSNLVISAANGESSDSNDVKEQNEQCACPHMMKSVDFNQVKKGLKNGEDLKKNFCPICIKERKALQGNELFICLKCGTKTCGSDHSLAHFKVPRSDMHALAYDVKSQNIWCYSCNVEIKNWGTQNNKLNNCITSLNHQMSSFSNNEKTVQANDNSESLEQTVSNVVDKKTKKWNAANDAVNQSSLHAAPVKGLSNLGNTCYFNSVMQCLARTQPLITELEEMNHKSEIRLELNGGETLEGSLEKWDAMSECLHKTLISLLSSGSALDPSKFLNFVRKKHPQFEGCDQHDAHELLRHTLDSIRLNDLKRYRRLMLAKWGLTEKVDPKEVPKEVQKLLKELEHKVTQVQMFIPEKSFKGKLVSRVECQECHHSSECIEGFLDLSLPILADKPHPPVAKRKVNNPPSLFSFEKDNSRITTKERLARRLAKKNGENSFAVLDPLKTEVDIDVQAVDAEPDADFGVEEDKPHESGYSSEKASSSLRGSPSSEEVRSSSPCDDTWATTPQFPDCWLTSVPEGPLLPIEQYAEQIDHSLYRAPTSIPLECDGTPNLAYLSLHDSLGSTLNTLCLDTSIIMEQEPDWQMRIHARYFSSNESENSNSLLKADSNQDIPKELYNETMHSPQTSDYSINALVPIDCSTTSNLLTVNTSLPDVIEASGIAECSSSKPSCLRETENPGVPMSPPLRKAASPPKNSAFSPVREECELPDTSQVQVNGEDAFCSALSRCINRKVQLEGLDCAFKPLARSGACSGGRADSDDIEIQPLHIGDTESVDEACGENGHSVLKTSVECEKEGFQPELSCDPCPSPDIESSHPIDENQPDSPSIAEGREWNEELRPDPDAFNGKRRGSMDNKCEEELTPLIPKLHQELDGGAKQDLAHPAAMSSTNGRRKDNRDLSECSVESCLRQFTSIEFMTGSNKVGCSACTERQNKGNKDGKTVLRMATKQLLIGQAPPILVLHLKRFQVQQHSLRKLSKHISFPLILDLASFRTTIGDDCNKANNELPMPYNLYAIVEHRGTLYSGHYVAYVKTEDGDKRRWYCISDSHITEVTEDRVLKTEAYLLFYSRLPTVSMQSPTSA